MIDADFQSSEADDTACAKESLNYIELSYSVPARLGVCVDLPNTVKEKCGVIVDGQLGYLVVIGDDGHEHLVHPLTPGIEYFGKGV